MYAFFKKQTKKFKTPYCSIKVPAWSDLSQYISHNVLTPTSTPPVPYISYPKRSWSNCRKASKSKFLFLLMSFPMQYTLPPPHKSFSPPGIRFPPLPPWRIPSQPWRLSSKGPTLALLSQSLLLQPLHPTYPTTVTLVPFLHNYLFIHLPNKIISSLKTSMAYLVQCLA